jgi:hypothetical protein
VLTGVATVAAATATATTLLVTQGSASPGRSGPSLADVRNATAAYHSIAAAEHAHYEPFLACFDDPAHGGMGQHFVDQALLKDNGRVSATHPEALVYEPRPDGYRLVAVEYVVPGPDTLSPVPTLFDQPFTYNATLGVWKLHAWIWRPNPAGMFADYNPDVRMCPGR